MPEKNNFNGITWGDLADLQDCLCIYKEHLFIRHVRIMQVDIDDSAVNFQFEVMPALGFETDDRESFQASTARDYGYFSDRMISSPWAGWMLVTQPTLVEQILRYAARNRDQLKLMLYVNKLSSSKAKT